MRYPLKTFLCIVLLGLLFSGCNTTPQPIEAEVNVNLEQNGSQQFKVKGTANLPDGMEVMINVVGPFDYVAQEKIEVSNGTIESEWFRDHENPNEKLNEGRYKVEISSPIASIQPPKVKNKIGKDGVFLQGKYIVQDQVGGKRLKYDTSVSIEGVNYRHLFAEKVIKLSRETLIEKLKKELNIDFVNRKRDDGTPEAEAKVFNWAVIWLVGDPNDLQNVSIQLNKTSNIETIYIWKTLQIAFPEWKDAYTWATQTIKEITTIRQGTKSKQILYGNKAIDIIYSAEMKRLTMTIVPLS